jgi:hypothetical protein
VDTAGVLAVEGLFEELPQPARAMMPISTARNVARRWWGVG